MTGHALRVVVVLAALCAALTLAPAAGADDDDVRRTGHCTGASEIELRLREDDGAIRMELRIDGVRPGRWSILVLHERRIAYRGVLRTTRSSDDVRLRRSVPDWFGRDSVTVRAMGSRSETCAVAAAI